MAIWLFFSVESSHSYDDFCVKNFIIIIIDMVKLNPNNLLMDIIALSPASSTSLISGCMAIFLIKTSYSSDT